MEILSSIAIACVLWFGGNNVIRGVTTLGVLVAFIQYAQRFFRPIQDLSEKYNILQSAMASSERVFKLLDTPTEITSPAVTKIPDGPGRIQFDHVWFAYRTVPAAEPNLAMWGRATRSPRNHWTLQATADSSSRPGRAGRPPHTSRPHTSTPHRTSQTANPRRLPLSRTGFFAM